MRMPAFAQATRPPRDSRSSFRNTVSPSALAISSANCEAARSACWRSRLANAKLQTEGKAIGVSRMACEAFDHGRVGAGIRKGSQVLGVGRRCLLRPEVRNQ